MLSMTTYMPTWERMVRESVRPEDYAGQKMTPTRVYTRNSRTFRLSISNIINTSLDQLFKSYRMHVEKLKLVQWLSRYSIGRVRTVKDCLQMEVLGLGNWCLLTRKLFLVYMFTSNVIYMSVEEHWNVREIPPQGPMIMHFFVPLDTSC